MGNKSFVMVIHVGRYVRDYGTLARILISMYAHVPQIIFPIDPFPFNDTFPINDPPVLEERYARGDAFESPLVGIGRSWCDGLFRSMPVIQVHPC